MNCKVVISWLVETKKINNAVSEVNKFSKKHTYVQEEQILYFNFDASIYSCNKNIEKNKAVTTTTINVVFYNILFHIFAETIYFTYLLCITTVKKNIQQ